MTDEEQRAANYRAEQIARVNATVARRKALHGSEEARAALAANWAPVTVPDPGFDVPCVDDLIRPITN